MRSSHRLARSDARIGRYARHAGLVLRVGLGVVILLAGLHKLVAPSSWHAYLAPPITATWPTSLLPLDPTFVAFGLSEVLFGGLLLADWHTPTVAVFTALSLLGVVVNLLLAVAVGEPFVDVLVRDLGLVALAIGVALEAAAPAGRPERSS
ncbi:MAG: DoxX family membrane protein [Halobacteriales archaeon]